MPQSFWALTLLQGQVTGGGELTRKSVARARCVAVASVERVVTGMKMRSDAQDFVQRGSGRLRKTKVSEDGLAWRIRKLVQFPKS